MPAGLAVPWSEPATPNLVDLDQLWSVAEPANALVAFMAAHVAGGLNCDTAGSTGGDISYGETLVKPPAGIASAQLLVEVAPAGEATRSVLRLDAQVVFLPPRDPRSFVPAADTFARVARTDATGKSASVAVSDPVAVAQLRTVVDGLAVAAPGASSCPSFSLAYSAAFSRSPTAAPDFVAATGPCLTVQLTVNGTPVQPDLRDADGSFDRLLGTLLGPG